MFDRSQFHTGDDVHSSDDQKIGSIHAVGPNYFEISTGFLGLGKHLFVPFDAVSNAADGQVFLDVTREEIDQRGWDQRPAEAGGAAAGMYGTMPSATMEAPTETWVTSRDVQGKTIYDWDGNEIGKAADVNQDYVHVPTGVFGLGPDLYIPFDEINYCTADGCYVHASLDQIKSMNWAQRPMEYGSGMTGTGPSPSQTSGFGVSQGETRRVPFYEEELMVRRH